MWSPRSELNGHALRPRLLRPLRIPVPPRGVFDEYMRLGVTGRSRTDTSGVTFHGSAVELQPHPSTRAVYRRAILRALAQRSSTLRSSACASRLAKPRT